MGRMSLSKLRKALAVIQLRTCGYVSRTSCDCKFGIDEEYDKIVGEEDQLSRLNLIGRLSYGERNGCPEIRFLESFFENITTEEFDAVCERIGASESAPLGVRMSASSEYEASVIQSVLEDVNKKIDGISKEAVKHQTRSKNDADNPDR